MSDLLAALADVTPVSKLTAAETAAEAAARLEITEAEASALRASLGCHFREIRSAEQTPDGWVVDEQGVKSILRTDSAPDGNGHSGWLFLGRPDGRTEGGKDPLPVYARPVFAPKAEPKDEPKKPTRGKASDVEAD